MATNSNQQQQNNVFINAFTGGMNTDVSVSSISNAQYTYMQNYRIATLSALGADANPNSRAGIVTPVEAGVNRKYNNEWFSSYYGVLATASIDNDGVIIVKDSQSSSTYHWSVYHVHTDSNGVRCSQVFDAQDAYTTKDKFSVVLNRETNEVLNLYIADGDHGIITINVLDNSFLNVNNIQQAVSGGLYPSKQAIISKSISGSLETSQVQYCYRFYKKHGVFSKLSPETRPLHVINYTKSEETGCAEKTKTAVGFRLKIPAYDTTFQLYNYVQLFRIQRLTEDEVKVYLVVDRPIKDWDNLVVDDTGAEFVTEYSIEEFAAMQSQLDLVPRCIESVQHRMFQANVTDQTIIIDRDLTGIQSHTLSTQKNKYEISQLNAEDGTSIPVVDCRTYMEDPLYEKYYINNGRSCNDSFADDSNKFYPGTNIYGGASGNISWKFVYTRIPLHNTDGDKLIGCNAATYSLQTWDNNVMYVTDGSYTGTDTLPDQSQYYELCGIEDVSEITTDSGYNGTLAASMMRSLRRDETYRYGIVYYDANGKHSNVQWIDDIKVPSESVLPTTVYDNGVLYAQPIGIQFEVKDFDSDFVTYQIVRCAKLPEYTKNLYQVVLNPTVHNSLNVVEGQSKMSPWYPMPFLLTHPIGFYTADHTYEDLYWVEWSRDNSIMFRYCKPYWPNDENQFIPHNILSEDINIRRNTTQANLAQDQFKLTILYKAVCGNRSDFNDEITVKNNEGYMPYAFPGQTFDNNSLHTDDDHEFYYLDWQNIERSQETGWYGFIYITNVIRNAGFGQGKPEWDKTNCSLNFAYYNRDNIRLNQYKILEAKDTKQPSATDGFSNIQWQGEFVQSFSSKYQQFTTSIQNVQYLNWFCGFKYGLGGHAYQLGVNKNHGEDDGGSQSSSWGEFKDNGYDPVEELTGTNKYRAWRAYGWHGPGPVSLIVALRNEQASASMQPWMENSITDSDSIGCYVCNISHNASDFNGISKTARQYDTYYGHGCYGTINKNGEEHYKQYVFDGEMYIAPAELISMYKAYEFNSTSDSLPSNQIVNYVPMESVINPYFEYGLNYRNTNSANVMVEPGEVTGVVSQDRPAYSYNNVYSCNEVTPFTYTTDNDNDTDQTFPCRIFYSEQKTDGEAVDNWGVYKAISYIDADTRWGQITNLLSSKDILYLWQKRAFGKLSVNERSLVTDENSNTVQLGEGGVLERVDYLDTTHGMREGDFAAITIGSSVYWIDADNRMIINYGAGGQYSRMQVDPYSVKLNVQNILNQKFEYGEPVYVEYDVQNSELLCKCMTDGDQLIFKPSLGVAQSVYTRQYDNTITLDGVLYGVNKEGPIQYNKLQTEDDLEYLSPSVLQYVVNSSSTVTKVFDNQQITIAQNTTGLQLEQEFMTNRELTFNTDLYKTDHTYDVNNLPNLITNREGNIQYAIPRTGNSDYGNRLRGKWMQVTMTDNNPVYDYTVATIITKFRQSFS